MKTINEYSIDELKEIKKIEKRLRKALNDYANAISESLNMTPDAYVKEIVEELGTPENFEEIIDGVIKMKEGK